MSDELPELGDSEDGEVVVESLSLGKISFEREVPVNGISSIGEVFFDEDWGGKRQRRGWEGKEKGGGEGTEGEEEVRLVQRRHREK